MNDQEYEEVLKVAIAALTEECNIYIINAKGIHQRCKKKAYFTLRKQRMCLSCVQQRPSFKSDPEFKAINPLFQSMI